MMNSMSSGTLSLYEDSGLWQLVASTAARSELQVPCAKVHTQASEFCAHAKEHENPKVQQQTALATAQQHMPYHVTMRALSAKPPPSKVLILTAAALPKLTGIMYARPVICMHMPMHATDVAAVGSRPAHRAHASHYMLANLLAEVSTQSCYITKLPYTLNAHGS